MMTSAMDMSGSFLYGRNRYTSDVRVAIHGKKLGKMKYWIASMSSLSVEASATSLPTSGVDLLAQEPRDRGAGGLSLLDRDVPIDLQVATARLGRVVLAFRR